MNYISSLYIYLVFKVKLRTQRVLIPIMFITKGVTKMLFKIYMKNCQHVSLL
jgi:hypothetical protein